ncbi:MAG: hypothetical protein AAF399_19340, partial [Bacteroidota bacterium]
QETLAPIFESGNSLISPIAPYRLGDFGKNYQEGFEVVGNVFEMFQLSVEPFLLGEEPSMQKRNYFLFPEHGIKTMYRSVVNPSGKLMAWVQIRFRSTWGFLLHLQGVKSEWLCLNTEIESLIQELVQLRIWQSDFRLIWHREAPERSTFIHTLPQGGQIGVSAEIHRPYDHLADHTFQLAPEDCENVVLDHVVYQEGPGVPIISLARFDSKSLLGRGPAGIHGYEDLPEIFQVSSFSIDNTPSDSPC